MANRIKDALEPKVYDYYKQHRSKYQRFASDLTVLNARLLQGMMADGMLPQKTKKEYNWERERKCVYWLYNITGNKFQTFADFRKIFKNRLRNFKFESSEYYDECERIIQENDVEFVKESIRAESIRKFVAKSYESSPSDFYAYKLADNSSLANKLYHNSADGRYDWHIENEPSYSGNATIQYLVTKNHRECLTYFKAWNIVQYVEERVGTRFSDFCAKYKDYLDGLNGGSKDFIYQCYVILVEENINTATPLYQLPKRRGVKELRTRDADVIAESASNMFTPILEHKKDIERIASNTNLSNDSENSLEWLKFCFSCVLSFFVFGGVAYVLKHLMFLAYALIATIVVCIINIICLIFGIIFNIDMDMMPFQPDYMIEPLTVWQIGGWGYGIIMVIIIICTIVNRKEFSK